MKKVMLIIASLLFVSVMAVNAQVSTDTSSVSGQPPVTDDMSNYTRDMELIQSSEVPASLRSTLQGTEYSGWEEGKVYRNSTTNEYLIVIGDEDAKVFRFDANGSKIEDTQDGTSANPSAPVDPNAPAPVDPSTPTDPNTPADPNAPADSNSGSTDSGSGSTDQSSPTGTTGSGSTSGSTSGSSGTTGGSTTPPTPTEK